MKTITKEEYYKIHKDFRGVWSREDYPDYIGKRTMLDYDKGTALLIEDYHFKIV